MSAGKNIDFVLLSSVYGYLLGGFQALDDYLKTGIEYVGVDSMAFLQMIQRERLCCSMYHNQYMKRNTKFIFLIGKEFVSLLSRTIMSLYLNGIERKFQFIKEGLRGQITGDSL